MSEHVSRLNFVAFFSPAGASHLTDLAWSETYGDGRRSWPIFSPCTGIELVHCSWNCHLDVCAPTELGWSNADLIIPDCTRLCQAGPMFDGHVYRCLLPRLEGVSNAAPWHPMDRALTIVFRLSDTVRKWFSLLMLHFSRKPLIYKGV